MIESDTEDELETPEKAIVTAVLESQTTGRKSTYKAQANNTQTPVRQNLFNISSLSEGTPNTVQLVTIHWSPEGNCQAQTFEVM